MKLLILVALFIPSLSFAKKNCEYKVISTDLTWTAFKTPAKAPVKGKFTEVKILSKKAKSIKELIQTSRFVINSDSVNTTDKARDVKIVAFFFKKLSAGLITGKVKSYKNDIIKTALTMNGETKNVDFKTEVNENKIKLTGSIDVLNFKMKDALDSLTMACKEKHEGVTWPTVDLELNLETKCD